MGSIQTKYRFLLKDHEGKIVTLEDFPDFKIKEIFFEWAMSFGYTEEQIGILMCLGYAWYSTDLEKREVPELTIEVS